ncbi:MAG: hypothetical protein JST00_20030 [Deltaproteobacteria bacterium]|nr:hypothetical protein [Deltaproteobacteria bacterium]
MERLMDVVCGDDLDEFGAELDDPIEELWQDVLHMLLEDFGSNVDASERSIALEAALSGSESLTAIRHRVESKLSDDERIIAVDVAFQQTDGGQAGSSADMTLKIQANAGVLGVTLLFDGSGNYRGFRR